MHFTKESGYVGAMPRFSVLVNLIPALPNNRGTGPCEPRMWTLIEEAETAEDAHRAASEKMKKAVKIWGGKAWIYPAHLIIEPVTPPVLPRPWLDGPEDRSISGVVGLD